MNQELVLDVIKDLTKFKDDYSKKKIIGLPEALDNVLNFLKSFKDEMLKASNSSEDQSKNDEMLNQNISLFLKPIEIILSNKYAKLYIPFLSYLKKLIEYKLILQNNSSKVVLILKSFFDNPSTDEVQLKILEILQFLIFSSILELNLQNLAIIFMINFKCSLSINKNVDFKNPIRLLLTTLIDNVYKSKNIKIIYELTNFFYRIYSEDKTLVEDPDFKEIKLSTLIGDNISNINFKFLCLDIVLNGLNIYLENKGEDEISLLQHQDSDFKKLFELLRNNFNKAFEKDLEEINKKSKGEKSWKHIMEDSISYLHSLKIIKIIVLFTSKLKVGFCNLNIILDFLDDSNLILWQKNICLEILPDLSKESDLILYMFKNEPKVFEKLYDRLNCFVQQLYIKSHEKKNNYYNTVLGFVNQQQSKSKNKKFMDNSKRQIYLSGDEITINYNISSDYYIHIIIECLQYTLNTYISLMRKYEISITDIDDSELKDDKLIIKNLLEKNASNMKEMLFTLLTKETLSSADKKDNKDSFSQQGNVVSHSKKNKKSSVKNLNKLASNNNTINNMNIINESLNLQTYLTIIQNLIGLYNCLNLSEVRNDYLKTLCLITLDFKTATDSGINKNITMGLTLLSLSKCTNILVDEESWVILLEAIQRLNVHFNNKKYLTFNNDSINYNMDVIRNDIYSCFKIFFVGINDDNINEDKDSMNSQMDGNESSENLQRLTLGIRSIFIDCKNFKQKELENIISALKQCIQNSMKKYSKNSNNQNNLNSKDFYEEIQFYLVKIFTICLLCIENANILFFPFNDVIQLLLKDKILTDFCFDLLCTYITEIIVQNKMEERGDKIISIDNNNKINVINNSYNNSSIEQLDLSDEKFQTKIFAYILDIVKQKEIVDLIGSKIFPAISKMIQKCGNYLDSYGWNSIIEILSFLIKTNQEEIYNILTQMLNDFSLYLTPFNISFLTDLLGELSLYEKDSKICFSSVELFWTCANIMDNFQQNKAELSKNSQSKLNDLLKDLDKNKFYSEIWEKIFNKLPVINNDSRTEVKKSGINVLTEIFVAKMQILDEDTRIKIIENIFLIVFNSNIEKYIENEKNLELQNNELASKKENDAVDNNNSNKQNNNIIKANTMQDNAYKENILEVSLQLSIISLTKILKAYYSLKNLDNKKLELFNIYLDKINTVIAYGTTQLNSDILKGLLEIKDDKNYPIIIYQLKSYFNIMKSIGNFVQSEKFTPTQFNKTMSQKLLKNMINNFRTIFVNESTFQKIKEQKEYTSSEIIKNIFEVLDCLFKAVIICDRSFIEQSKRKIQDIEKEIFELVECLKFSEKNEIINYLLNFVTYNFQNPHSECLCKRSLEAISNFYKLNNNRNKNINNDNDNNNNNNNNNNNINNSNNINNNNNELPEYLDLKVLYTLIDKVKVLLLQRNQNEIIESLVENTPKNPSDSEKTIFSFHLKQVLNTFETVFQNILMHKQIDQENCKYSYDDLSEFINKIIELFETIFKQSILGFNNIKKNYQNILIESSYQIHIDIINFIVKNLIPNSLIFLEIKDKKDEINAEKTQDKLLKLFDLGCGINLSNTAKDMNISGTVSVNEISLGRVCIFNLIELCKYKSDEEIINELNSMFSITNVDAQIQEKFKNDLIRNKKKIAKISLPILVKNCMEFFKKFMEDEIKTGDMPLNRNRINDTVAILDSIKKLNVYSDLSDENVKNKSFEEITVLDVIGKSQKIHLFYLQPILADFIVTKEREIKALIREIFKEISNVIGLKVN